MGSGGCSTIWTISCSSGTPEGSLFSVLLLRLPLEKVTRLQSLVDWCRKHSCTRKELESFIGHLAHAVTVISTGRIFLRSRFDLLALMSRLYHYVRLFAPVRADSSGASSFIRFGMARHFFLHHAPLITCIRMPLEAMAVVHLRCLQAGSS